MPPRLSRLAAALAIAALLIGLASHAAADPIVIHRQDWDGPAVEILDVEGPQVAQLQVEGPQRAQRRIFVPQPRGADDTLDDSARGGKHGKGDVVTTIRGDKIVGKVISIEAGGKLHLTAPHFEGEVVILASALDTVQFTPTENPKGHDAVNLSNDDRIVGEVTAITPDAVIVETKATGPVKVARKIIRSVNFARGTLTAIDSNFENGRLEPWTARGPWTVADGAAQCTVQGDCATLFAKFDQEQAVTMEAQVAATFNRYIHVELILGADNTRGQYGSNSLIARFYASQFNLMVMRNGGMNSFADRNIGRLMRKATVRLAYDPATNKAHAWLDGMDLGEHAVPGNIGAGKFVMFNARYPCRVTRLRVVQGVVPPTVAQKEDARDTHVVRFVNRDRIAATDLTLADSKVNLKTAFGDIAADADKLLSIAFRTKDIEKPRRNKGDVLVETANSRLTVQFQSLDDKYLVGKSSSLGQIKILRSCLKRISFNIYR